MTDSYEKILSEVEEILLTKQPKYDYRESLIACIVLKGFTLKTAIEISEKKMLLCGAYDMNVAISVKNNIRIYYMGMFNTDENLEKVHSELGTNKPQSVINQEIQKMLLASKKLVSEITELIDTFEIKSIDESILVLFDEETQKKVKEMMVASFKCFSFDFNGILSFKRKDQTEFTHETEISMYPVEKNLGLSRRPFIPDGAGMWYMNGAEDICGFITEDVVRDLSVAYVKNDGTIVEIIDRKANDSEVYYNKEPAAFVLEITMGWFEENNIHVGDTVRLKTIIANYT